MAGDCNIVIQSIFPLFFSFCPFQFKILKHLITKALKRIYTLYFDQLTSSEIYLPQKCAYISSYKHYMAYHTMSAYMKTYKMWMYSKNYSAITIFKARHKIIMKSCEHNTVLNRKKYITLSGKLQQQKTRGIFFFKSTIFHHYSSCSHLNSSHSLLYIFQ